MVYSIVVSNWASEASPTLVSQQAVFGIIMCLGSTSKSACMHAEGQAELAHNALHFLVYILDLEVQETMLRVCP